MVLEAWSSVLAVLVPIGWATIVAFFLAVCGAAGRADGEPAPLAAGSPRCLNSEGLRLVGRRRAPCVGTGTHEIAQARHERVGAILVSSQDDRRGMRVAQRNRHDSR